MFKKILIAFDGSDQSKRALHYALVLSEKFNSELIILTVYHRPVFPALNPDEDLEGKAIDSDFTEYLETIKRSYINILSYAEEIAKSDWPSVKYVALLEEGRPSTEIMSTVESEAVDLVVLGNRGIGGVSGWVLGSTSKSVVEDCKKPVLVVK
jgi:nucleotide-binding universal stress UspA family protein